MSSPDSLSTTSRGFYERAKNKTAASIFLAGACLTLLGFCAVAGGISNSNNIILEEVDDDGDYVDAIRALAAGYGFASFVYFCAFVVFFSVALYISPLSCGSPNEKKMLQNPHELEGGYSAYSEDQPSPAHATPAPSQV